jgi:hypothetical protein
MQHPIIQTMPSPAALIPTALTVPSCGLLASRVVQVTRIPY